MYTAIFIVVLVSTTVLGQDQGHENGNYYEFKKNATECKATVKATDDDMKLVLKHVTPSSKTGQCLMACVLKKKGWMEKRKINAHAVKQALRQMEGGMTPKMMQKMTKCKAQAKSRTDECAIASKFTECFYPIRARNESDEEQIKKATEQCKASISVAEDDAKLAKVYEIPSTKSGQCFMACFQKKIGLMNANNTVNKAVATKFFKSLKRNKNIYEKTIKQLDACKAAEKKETDECLAAKNFAKCMHPPKKR